MSCCKASGPATPLVSRSRSFYTSQISRSPKESHHLSSYYHSKKKPKSLKKERGGPIVVYDISKLLPVSRQMALQYRIEPTQEACRHNAEVDYWLVMHTDCHQCCNCLCPLSCLQVALSCNRRDMYQIWLILAELVDKRLDPDTSSTSAMPFAHLPFGRPMVKSM